MKSYQSMIFPPGFMIRLWSAGYLSYCFIIHWRQKLVNIRLFLIWSLWRHPIPNDYCSCFAPYFKSVNFDFNVFLCFQFQWLIFHAFVMHICCTLLGIWIKDSFSFQMLDPFYFCPPRWVDQPLEPPDPCAGGSAGPTSRWNCRTHVPVQPHDRCTGFQQRNHRGSRRWYYITIKAVVQHA